MTYKLVSEEKVFDANKQCDYVLDEMEQDMSEEAKYRGRTKETTLTAVHEFCAHLADPSFFDRGEKLKSVMEEDRTSREGKLISVIGPLKLEMKDVKI